MHPWNHAESSEKIFGIESKKALPLHQWFDHTKSAFAFYTHRMLRHHREGIEVMVQRFGDQIDGVKTRHLGKQHLLEDCAFEPSAADWLACIEAPEWMPTIVPNVEQMATISQKKFGGDFDAHAALHAWFLSTRDWYDRNTHLSMRHHAFGIFEAEEHFGVVLNVGNRVIPTRYLAESHVRRILGRVPPASDWLRRVKGKTWMAQKHNLSTATLS